MFDFKIATYALNDYYPVFVEKMLPLKSFKTSKNLSKVTKLKITVQKLPYENYRFSEKYTELWLIFDVIVF